MPRKHTSVAEDILELVSRCPPWVGLMLAIIAYPLLHWLATAVPITAVKPAQMAEFFLGAFGHAVAMIAQYVLPALCLVGAGVSFFRRRSRQALFATVAHSNSAGTVDSLSWQEFEQLIGEAFRKQGFDVVEMGGAGADGGVDLVLTKGKEKTLVQCKHWKAQRVGVAIVRELYGLMAAKGAAAGYVVTSGRFTTDAAEFAIGRNIVLINGDRLLSLIRRSQTSTDSGLSEAKNLPHASVTANAPITAVACPACGSAMFKRMARKGPNLGTEFWGCSKYPSCRDTRPA